jgi:ArsR family transcriptional regulator, arsenate/arsenite/antimonite-responsive transcriptional repressor
MKRAHIEKISKALGDQTRLMIFEAIAKNREMNCGQLVSLRGVTPATVSHHLKILSDAGLIECRRHGQFVRSRVVPGSLAEYSRALARLSRGPERGRSK